MDSAKRVEAAARAMARYRLGMDSFVSSLNPDIVAKVRQSAEDKLWPSLVGEAKAMVEAIDTLEREADGRAIEQKSGQAPQDGGGPPLRVDKNGTARIAAPHEPSLDAGFDEKPAEPLVEQVPTANTVSHDRRAWLTRVENGVAAKVPREHELSPHPSAGAKPESKVEEVATASPSPKGGRDRLTRVENAGDTGTANVTPQQRGPSFDPATEALRSALEALAATGT